MSRKSEFILHLLCVFLFVQDGFQGAEAIAQLKQQQMPEQQIQAQQQHETMPASTQQQTQQTQQTVVQTSTTTLEKDNKKETMKINANQDSNLGHPFKLIRDIHHSDRFPQPLLPFGLATPSVPASPALLQSLSPGLPTPLPQALPPVLPPSLPLTLPLPVWNLNPFWNQRFSPPSLFASQPYSMPAHHLPPNSETPFSALPFRMPFIGYPQSFSMPTQPFFPQEHYYSHFPGAMNDYEEATSRAAHGHRPTITNGRDSPIYYMRLPSTPYMFLPNFGYPTNPIRQSLNYGTYPNNPNDESLNYGTYEYLNHQNGQSPNYGAYSTNLNGQSQNYGLSYSPFLPFQAMSPYPGLGHTHNLPLNFLANGKPTGIHSFLPDIQNSQPFQNLNDFDHRPLGSVFPGNYFQPSYNIPSPPPPFQDSKLTSLKQPFFFNGRPEDIYVLQNSINPLFSGI